MQQCTMGGDGISLSRQRGNEALWTIDTRNDVEKLLYRCRAVVCDCNMYMLDGDQSPRNGIKVQRTDQPRIRRLEGADP
jgi:hypothetical protein